MSIASTSRGGAAHWNGDRPLGLTGCDGSRCAQVVANIRHWQTQVRQPPFRDIAYNHLICPGCGTVHQGRGWGARSAANGTTAANREWHAWMVMVGGDEPFTDIAKRRLLELAREHRARYGRSKLTYHRAVRGGGTECPGTAIIGWVRAGASGEDWFTMATEEDLRRVVREEIDRATGGRDIGQDLRAIRLAVRGVLGRLGVTTRHDPPGAYDV